MSLELGFIFLLGMAAVGGGIKAVWDYNAEVWVRFDELMRAAAKKHGVPFEWIKAVCMNESSLGTYPTVAEGLRNPANVEGSKSQDGLSWGVMQVTLKTARGMDPGATEAKLNDPVYSIDLGARYLAQMMKQFSTSDPRYIEWVIKSYNQGPGNTAKERAGTSGGFAAEYWSRFQRNLEKVKANS